MASIYEPLKAPLDDDDKRTINAALERCNELDTLIFRAQQAGIDVTRYKLEKDKLQEQLRAIKNAFFPGS